VTAAAGALLAALLGGCGGGTVIDHAGAEADVRQGFDELGVRVRSVACPADVETREGALYACRATTSRGSFRVIYTQLDAEGRVGRPRLERVPEGA
jgi:Domain of unknown function (DUF4333)